MENLIDADQGIRAIRTIVGRWLTPGSGLKARDAMHQVANVLLDTRLEIVEYALVDMPTPEHMLFEEQPDIQSITQRQLDELIRGGWTPPVGEPSSAARDVLAERRRQVEVEGRTPESDDGYTGGELAAAAGSYALHANDHELDGAPCWWPWGRQWFKLSPDPRRNLVKAGALILAEIERLDRAAPAELFSETDEARMDVVGQNGNDGEHYECDDGWIAWDIRSGEPAPKHAAFAKRRDGEVIPAGNVNHWGPTAADDKHREIVAYRVDKPAPVLVDADGWIAWDGRNELPAGLSENQMLWVRLEETGAERPGLADRWTWGWEQADYKGFGRIVAYRLTPPDSAAS